MSRRFKKLLSILMAGIMPLSLAACGADVSGADSSKTNSNGGWLAVYPALYEANMGVEFAQFPSKEYTNTYRTGVLHYAISEDGVNFEPLNNCKPVLSPDGCVKLSSPCIVKKGSGYILVAVANDSSDIVIFDTDDLLYYKNQRQVSLSPDGKPIKSLSVVKSGLNYKLSWEGKDGKSYASTTSSFEKFSEPQEADYVKSEISAKLPEYAKADEAFILKLDAKEYERVVKKYSRLHSVSVDISDISAKVGEEIKLPETADVVYSDGSKTPMGVEWNLNGLDLNNLAAGEYTVKGKITVTAEYNSPLASYRADPYAVYDEEKGVYYFTGSNLNDNSANGGGAYGSIVIRQADSIQGITDAEEFEIWHDTELEDGTRVTGWYWAPEIHKIGGKWRIIALATVKLPYEKEAGWKQCIFTCNGDDLTKAENWEYTGHIHEATDGGSVGAFDTTYFEHDGKSYYVTPKWSSIWITTVDPNNPLYPTSKLVQLSTADKAYESNIGAGKAGFGSAPNGKPGQMIQEASSVLIHGDKIFIVYAGSTVDMMYCVCVLYADIDSDFLDPDSWHKYPYPILATQDLTETLKSADYFATDGTDNVTGHGDSGLKPEAEGEYTGTFGPGHNSFTVDENGNPVIIYHARDWSDAYPGATGDAKYGLVDPGRHAYAKPVIFNYEGLPVCSLTAQEYLADELRDVEIKITVK